jgi:uncharacterized protein (DUF2461 family)
MGSIGVETFRFMAELSQNNSKPWFNRNRDRYVEHVREPMKALAGMLEDPVALVLPEFSGKAKVSRINNDLRFAPNKPPYKTRMWISFGGESSRCANLFAGVGVDGWTTGAGIGDSKREPLDTWRTNLLEFKDVWRRYADAIGLGGEAQAHTENPYRKPLYSDLPDDLRDLVQARGVWLVDRVRRSFDRSPFEDFARGICRFLPAFLFMTLPAKNLPARLSELGTRIIAPDREIHDLWKSLTD